MGHIKKIYKVNDKEFNTREEAKIYIANNLEKDELIKKLNHHKHIITDYIDFHLIPCFKENKSLNYFDDEHINSLRDELYNLMCIRRKILNVVEYNK